MLVQSHRTNRIRGEISTQTTGLLVTTILGGLPLLFHCVGVFLFYVARSDASFKEFSLIIFSLSPPQASLSDESLHRALCNL